MLLARENARTFDYTKRVSISNNLFYDIGGSQWGGSGEFVQFASGQAASNGNPITGIADVKIDHNTVINTPPLNRMAIFTSWPSTVFGQWQRLVWTNNIMAHKQYGIIGDGGGGFDSAALRSYAAGATFTANAVNIDGAQVNNFSSYPGNYLPANWAAVGFLDLANDDYHLSTSSPYRNSGTDGSDIGADIDTINCATSGVIAGIPPSCSGTGPVLLADDFNATSLDPSKWEAINLNQVGGQIRMGEPFPGSGELHYDGIASANTYDFSGAYAQVQLVQGPASTSGRSAVLTVGYDVNNSYSIHIRSGQLYCEKKIGSTKIALASFDYIPSVQQFLRIRHELGSSDVVFETAPDNGGVPGEWTQRYSEVWNTSRIPIATIRFELQTAIPADRNAQGLVMLDNFKAEKL